MQSLAPTTDDCCGSYLSECVHQDMREVPETTGADLDVSGPAPPILVKRQLLPQYQRPPLRCFTRALAEQELVLQTPPLTTPVDSVSTAVGVVQTLPADRPPAVFTSAKTKQIKL